MFKWPIDGQEIETEEYEAEGSAEKNKIKTYTLTHQ